MKNHRFLWLRNRTTNNRKCEKARNIKEKRTIEMFSTVSKLHVVLHSSANVKFGSQRDNFSHTEKSRKAHFTRVTEVVGSCQMCWNFNGMQHICNKYATNISMICIGHFQSNLGMSFLRVTTSGAADSEYIEMMLASIEIYLLDDIARQRNMSKIALQSANDTD